mgnify:FL=1
MGKGIALILLILAAPAMAQTRAAQGKGVPRVAPAPKAGYNSTAKDTTPFNCDNYANHPHPLMKPMDRPAFRRHPVAIIDGNDRGVYGQQQAVHR